MIVPKPLISLIISSNYRIKLFSNFDGISSHAVIEHLGDTLFSWKYFNKLLKSIEKGGGIMVHSFPSQIHFNRTVVFHILFFKKLIIRK